MGFKVQVDSTFSSQQSNVCVLYIVCVPQKLKSQFILLFSLFLLLFIDPTALFGTIHGSYYTISANFFFYLQYFQ